MIAQELRIGNWVYKIENGGKCLYDVSSGERIDYIDELSGSTAYLEFEPIPLTEDWIKRLPGIEVNEWMHFLTLPNESALWFMEGKVYVAAYDCPNENYATETPVKYVHQLQNLYFALTGQELVFSDL